MPAAILAFGVTVAYWPGILSSAVAPRWALLAVGLPLVSWLDPRRLPLSVAVLLGLFLYYAGVSIAWTSDPQEGAHEFIHLLIFAAAVVAGAGFTGSMDAVMRATAWGIGVSVIVGLTQLAGWWTLPQGPSPSGLFWNRDFLAELAAIVFVWAVLSRESRAAAITSIPLIFCGSRVALSAAAIGLLATQPKLSRWLLPFAALATVLATFLYSGKVSSIGERLTLWSDTATGITAFGHGLGSFFGDHPLWEQAHSDLLQGGYELGIGALLFAALLACGLREHPSLPLRGAMVCVLVEYMVAFPLHLPAPTFLAGFLLGHLVRREPCVRLQHSFRGGDLVAAS